MKNIIRVLILILPLVSMSQTFARIEGGYSYSSTGEGLAIGGSIIQQVGALGAKAQFTTINNTDDRYDQFSLGLVVRPVNFMIVDMGPVYERDSYSDTDRFGAKAGIELLVEVVNDCYLSVRHEATVTKDIGVLHTSSVGVLLKLNLKKSNKPNRFF